MTSSDYGRTLPGWRTAALIAAWFAAVIIIHVASLLQLRRLGALARVPLSAAAD